MYLVVQSSILQIRPYSLQKEAANCGGNNSDFTLRLETLMCSSLHLPLDDIHISYCLNETT